MYRVFIRIEPDGDFWYENNIKDFDKDLAQIDLYFEKRDSITDMLKGFYHHMCETIDTDKKYIHDVVDRIKATETYFEMIINTFEYFNFDSDFGNQYIKIDVLPANPVSVKVQDSDEKIVLYDRDEPKFENEFPCFFEYNMKENWDWDKIKHSDKLWE